MNYPDDVPLVLNPRTRLRHLPAARSALSDSATKPRASSARSTAGAPTPGSRPTGDARSSKVTSTSSATPDLGGLSRGLCCIIGRIKVTLWLAALVAATNVAALAKWATRTGVGSDGSTLAPITDDEWACEELDPSSTTGSDPPTTSAPT